MSLHGLGTQPAFIAQIPLIACLVSGPVPDRWTWLGAGVIAASGIYALEVPERAP